MKHARLLLRLHDSAWSLSSQVNFHLVNAPVLVRQGPDRGAPSWTVQAMGRGILR